MSYSRGQSISVLVGDHKKAAIEKEFGTNLPDVGLGDRETDHNFMSLCKVCSLFSHFFVANVVIYLISCFLISSKKIYSTI